MILRQSIDKWKFVKSFNANNAYTTVTYMNVNGYIFTYYFINPKLAFLYVSIKWNSSNLE